MIFQTSAFAACISICSMSDVSICNGNIKDPISEYQLFILNFTFKLFYVSVAVTNI